MTIKELERQTGLPRTTIRFYEQEGLIAPERRENNYRDYSEEDAATLEKIKLLRKLDVHIEEILRLKAGSLTLTDAMGRHMIQLERRQANLEAMHALCAELRDSRGTLDGLDADGVLERIRRQEQEGGGFTVSPEEAPPLALIVVLAAIPVVVILGVLMALYQRIKQIRGGEEDDAAQY